MRSHSLILACLTALFIASSAVGQSPTSTCLEPGTLQGMMQELRSLRIELIEEKLQRADALLIGLQQQLQAAEAERERIAEVEQSQSRELAEIGQQLLTPGLTPQDQSELERQRSTVIDMGPRLAEFASAAAGRESQFREQLRLQRQTREQLAEKLRVLTGAALINR